MFFPFPNINLTRVCTTLECTNVKLTKNRVPKIYPNKLIYFPGDIGPCEMYVDVELDLFSSTPIVLGRFSLEQIKYYK